VLPTWSKLVRMLVEVPKTVVMVLESVVVIPERSSVLT